MSLQIAQREREAIAVLDLHGELVLGDDHLAILRHLLVLLDSRRHKVILNLTGGQCCKFQNGTRVRPVDCRSPES